MSCQWLGKGLSIKALLFNLSAHQKIPTLQLIMFLSWHSYNFDG